MTCSCRSLRRVNLRKGASFEAPLLTAFGYGRAWLGSWSIRLTSQNPRLEDELRTQLNQAGVNAILSARPGIQDAAEVGRVGISTRPTIVFGDWIEVRVVEDVKELDSELYHRGLRNPSVLVYREVRVV